MDFLTYLRRPGAVASLGGQHSNVAGLVRFYETPFGVLVRAEIDGLPSPSGIYAFHIHEGADCENPGTHYNPGKQPHPQHAGDLPPLFSANGRAFSVFLTDRFALRQVFGRTVILHSGVDDFTTQPSGNPGQILACGKIISSGARTGIHK